MKAALIGAASSLGTRLIETFQLGAGPTLAAVVRHPAELISAARFTLDLRVADFTRIDSLAHNLRSCSAVIYIPPPGMPAEMKQGVATVCRAAAQAGVKRIVFVGSADVHGVCPLPGTDEKTPLHTDHPDEYPNALVFAERQFLTECRELGIAGHALRAGFLYGPRVPAFASIADSLAEDRAWLFQSGKGICNCVYVDHLVSAILLALKTKVAPGSAYLISDGEALTWRDFYQTTALELNAPASAIRYLEDAATQPGSLEKIRSTPLACGRLQAIPPASPPLSPEMIARQRCTWKLPIARATRELNYRPDLSFTEAIRRSCAWWRFAHGEFHPAA